MFTRIKMTFSEGAKWINHFLSINPVAYNTHEHKKLINTIPFSRLFFLVFNFRGHFACTCVWCACVCTLGWIRATVHLWGWEDNFWFQFSLPSLLDSASFTLCHWVCQASASGALILYVDSVVQTQNFTPGLKSLYSLSHFLRLKLVLMLWCSHNYCEGLQALSEGCPQHRDRSTYVIH